MGLGLSDALGSHSDNQGTDQSSSVMGGWAGDSALRRSHGGMLCSNTTLAEFLEGEG